LICSFRAFLRTRLLPPPPPRVTSPSTSTPPCPPALHSTTTRATMRRRKSSPGKTAGTSASFFPLQYSHSQAYTLAPIFPFDDSSERKMCETWRHPQEVGVQKLHESALSTKFAQADREGSELINNRLECAATFLSEVGLLVLFYHNAVMTAFSPYGKR